MSTYKKISIFVIAFMFLLCMLKSTFAATGTVNTELVRVRAEASTESEILTRLEQGATVEILEEQEQWYQIETGEITGYISKEFLDVTEDTANTTDTQEGQTTGEQINETSEEEPQEVIGNIINTDSSVYLLPSFNSSELFTISKDSEVTVIKTVNNWSNIEFENQKGWIPNQKLITAETQEETTNTEETPTEETPVEEDGKKQINQTGYVSTESAHLRDGPSTSNNSIAGLVENEVLLVISEENDWYEVRTTDGTNGYVSKSLVTLGTPPANTTSRSAESRVEAEENTVIPTISATSSNNVVNVAMQYLGYNYVSGGSSPSTGFDCSGFTSYVFAQCGKTLSRTSSGQASNGVAVEKSELQPGDLVLFHYYGGSSIGHVGIYIGNGEFIHAANANRGVVTDTINSGYYANNYAGARRII